MKNVFQEINLNLLVPSKLNVRHTLEDYDTETTIEDLAKDIRQNGLIHPICVRQREDEKYEIYAGLRRYLALKKLKVETVTCRVNNVDDDNALLISLAENLQRQKMLQKDKCEIFYKLFKILNDVNKVSKSVNYSIQTVKDYITIKENLNPLLLDKLDLKGDAKLSMELALHLCKNISQEDQIKVYEQIIQLGTQDMKKQTILNFKNMNKEEEDDDDSVPPDEENKPETEPKEKESPVKIPKTPWIFDEEQKPMLIPKELYMNVLELVRKYY
jgi:ParB family chromosome partitioning protein